MEDLKVTIKVIVSIIVSLITVFLMILLFAIGSRQRVYKILDSDWDVWSQKNTTWMSENEKIIFQVDNDRNIVGTMQIGQEVINIEISGSAPTELMLDVYILNDDRDGRLWAKDKLESWSCSYKAEDKIVVKIYESVFDRKGEKFILYRIGDSKE